MLVVLVTTRGTRSLVNVPAPELVIQVQTGIRTAVYDLYTIDASERLVYHERAAYRPSPEQIAFHARR